MTELTFNNLVVGRKYSINFNPYYGFTGGTDTSISVTIKNGSTVIGSWRQSGLLNDVKAVGSRVPFFTATDTTVTFSVSSNGGTFYSNPTIQGAATNAELIDHRSMELTTDYN